MQVPKCLRQLQVIISLRDSHGALDTYCTLFWLGASELSGYNITDYSHCLVHFLAMFKDQKRSLLYYCLSAIHSWESKQTLFSMCEGGHSSLPCQTLILVNLRHVSSSLHRMALSTLFCMCDPVSHRTRVIPHPLRLEAVVQQGKNLIRRKTE